MKSSKYGLIVVAFLMLIMALGPVANLFTMRNIVTTVSSDKQFGLVSARLQTSCSDCHTPGATIMPWYADLPMVNNTIHNDIVNAQSAFVLSRQNLSGETPFTPLQLNKMQAVLRQNYMPPPRYLALHWKTIIPKEEKKALLDWIEKHDPNFN